MATRGRQLLGERYIVNTINPLIAAPVASLNS
jgi:hypothetical protein